MAILFLPGILALGCYLCAAAVPEKREKVLYVGDSLSVGKFGEFIGEYLVEKLEPKNVELYASCGSSPENWIRDGIQYDTRCGWRQLMGGHSIMRDPGWHDTPKIEKLIADFKPTTVIVQMGTNWMDRLTRRPSKEAEIRAYLREFVAVVHRPPVQRVVWIAPPDSSHYSKKVQEKVAGILEDASHGGKEFEIIDSRRMTKPYKLGTTGGDGVHYREKAARDWSGQVKKVLGNKGI
jgi:hypothetical protein